MSKEMKTYVVGRTRSSLKEDTIFKCYDYRKVVAESHSKAQMIYDDATQSEYFYGHAIGYIDDDGILIIDTSWLPEKCDLSLGEIDLDNMELIDVPVEVITNDQDRIISMVEELKKDPESIYYKFPIVKEYLKGVEEAVHETSGC